jgi:antitoxin HicB
LVLDVRIESGDIIPLPMRSDGLEWVEPYAATQAALLIHWAREAEQRSLTDLARALGASWLSVKRLEDPRHPPTIRPLERAAAALGKHLVLSFESFN